MTGAAGVQPAAGSDGGTATPGRRLREHLARWRTLGPVRHLAALAALLAAMVVLFPAATWGPEALYDEAIYQRSWEAAGAGRSPFEHGEYLYPPSFASLGAMVADGTPLGRNGLRLLLRFVNLAALALLLWFTGWWLPTDRLWPRRPLVARWIAAATLLGLPGVRLGIDKGNLSFLVGAALLLALLNAGRRPVAAGLALAASLLTKPLAAGALPVFGAPAAKASEGSADGRWPPLLAAVVAIVVAGTVLLTRPGELVAMLGQPLPPVAVSRTVSVDRLLRLLGLADVRLALFATLCLIVALVAWRLRPLDVAQRLTLALFAAVFTAPAAWSHTLVLFLPVAAMALFLAAEPTGAERWRRVVLVTTLAAVVAFAQPGGFGGQAVAVQILLLLPPLLAPPLLAGYVVAILRRG